MAGVVAPTSTPGAAGSWWAGMRLVAIDGTAFDVPDTASNQAGFGRPASGRGNGLGAFPQARVVALAECGTHAIIGAQIGACTIGEATLARGLFTLLGEGMLLLADRGFGGYDLWQGAAATGAQLCWRTKANAVLPVTQALPDGSYLSFLRPPRGNPGGPIAVRVVEYTLSHPSRGADEAPVRLLTTLLDPTQAPATELAALYAQRWEQESAFDELKTHQRGAGRVLRSKSPEMVIQEIYAHLLVYYAIRVLTNRGAEPIDLDPDRVSFIRFLPVARRQVTDQAAFPPLNTWPPPSPKPPARSCTGSTHDGCESTPESSNARCPNGPSIAPNTATQHDRRHHRPTRSPSPAPPARNVGSDQSSAPNGVRTLAKWYWV